VIKSFHATIGPGILVFPSFRNFSLSLLLLLFCLFPFFEGGETALGLFLFHTIILIAFCSICLGNSRVEIPHFLIYFLPFFLSMIISTLVAPYKYAAVLQLWDYFISGILAVTATTIFLENKDHLSRFLGTAFLIGATADLISILLGLGGVSYRIHGTFPNPNDFATFTLLLIMLGCLQVEQESNRTRRIFMLILIFALGVALALASSRSAFLGAAFFFIPYLWWRRTNKALLAIGATLFVILVAALTVRFTHYTDPFQYYRWKIWTNSLKGILQDPYLGIGLNMLPYRAPQFNFPADAEIGRYAKIATTADSQYLQILGETGFLGFFTFLIGWFALFFALRNLPDRLKMYRYFFYVVSVICVFSLPINNTSIFSLFIICSLFALVHTPQRYYVLSLNAATRIATAVLVFILFSVFVFLPFAADFEFKQALAAKDGTTAQQHLSRALLFNPYQPYYRFVFVKRILQARPQSTPELWLRALEAVNDSIQLNPLESDFYTAKADILSILFELTGNHGYYIEALAAYQTAIDRSPYNVFLRSKYALFLSKNGRSNYAELHLRKALELEPAYLGARLLLVRVKFEEGDISDAQKEFQSLEAYQDKYRNYVPPDTYYKLLLQVDPQLKDQVKQLIFHDSQK